MYKLVKSFIHYLIEVGNIISVRLIQLSSSLSVFCKGIIVWQMERILIYICIRHCH